MTHKQRWLKNYALAKKYYEEHGDLLIPLNYTIVDDDNNLVNLGNWIGNARKAYKGIGTGKLTEEQISLLNDIGMVWFAKNGEGIISDIWYNNYNLAKRYYEEYGNLLIPSSYTVIDDNNNLVNLGNWINAQRGAYKGTNGCRLSKEQIKLLDVIKMEWTLKTTEENISPNWLKKYALAKRYYEEHGDLLIPFKYEVIDEDGNVVKLGDWINAQRKNYKGKSKHILTSKQIELLNEIDMVYSVHYYHKLLKRIELEYYYYEHGLLDYKNVSDLINKKILEYKDSEITKGSALLLQRNKMG